MCLDGSLGESLMTRRADFLISLSFGLVLAGMVASLTLRCGDHCEHIPDHQQDAGQRALHEACGVASVAAPSRMIGRMFGYSRSAPQRGDVVGQRMRDAYRRAFGYDACEDDIDEVLRIDENRASSGDRRFARDAVPKPLAPAPPPS